MRRATAVLGTVAVVGGLVAAGWFGLTRAGLVAATPGCTARVESLPDVRVELTPEQAGHAATISAIGVARGLPARAVTIALATAYQESGLRNLDHGDRDSLGLFQQRPSMGWGTAEQVQDPAYAANRFYDALVRIVGYEQMEVTDAAQAVQRSAFPLAYADHEADARVLASAMTGHSPAAFTCTVAGPEPSGTDEVLNADGLTPTAQRMVEAITSTFGQQSLGGFEPGGAREGRSEGSPHWEGRALDVFFAPDDPSAVARGWALAHWLVAGADELDVAVVIYQDRIWSSTRSAEGWRAYTPPNGPSDDPTLRHLDHVHVDVVDHDPA